LVITAPTGSGKSTQVPRWCGETGAVLVIEPRRIACRALAKRVAELEGEKLGDRVGYSVREDHRHGSGTRILFATPGVVLNWIAADKLPRFETVILDEFHERRGDTDLLFALFLRRFSHRLVVMSATMDAGRIAAHMGAEHLHAEGRVFPVSIHYLAQQTLLPDPRDLDRRALSAIETARDHSGDVLVFLPGKAEISRLFERLSHLDEFTPLQLHGGLTLKEQSRVFEPGSKRRVILATNVAETSLTIPRIEVVIDSGLVRRTRYRNGRGFLTLVPVAMDSADQRAGRAGRTSKGICYRLFGKNAVLEKRTPPEIYRESLAPLLLGAAACGADPNELPFLDPPKAYAVASAQGDLQALGAIEKEGRITERGQRLFGLPLDAPLGSLLIEAERGGCIEEAIDLVSVLAVGRPLFTGDKRPEIPEDDLRIDGCDGMTAIRAIRDGNPKRHGLHPFVLGEARRIRIRLRRAWCLSDTAEPPGAVNRKQLVRAAVQSDPRCAHIARSRRGRVFWGNGGTEIELTRSSAVDETKTEAIAVLETLAVGRGYRDTRLYASVAMPVPLVLLAQAGLGTEKLSRVSKEGRTIVAHIERIYAGKTIETREEVPTGAHARDGIERLFLEGRIFRKTLEETKDRLDAAELFRRLGQAGLADRELESGPWDGVSPIPLLEVWVREKLSDLGVESGDDLGLLSPDDLLAPDLPLSTRSWLDQKFPRTLCPGDAIYRISYDLEKRVVTLIGVSGTRKDPPSISTLPAFRGFKVRLKQHSKILILRQ
jgi:ATP-dependent helicase HrpB